MVTRCIKALDRLEEVSQHIYKKSSVQEKIRKVEARLSQPSVKKKSIQNEGRKLRKTRVANRLPNGKHAIHPTSKNISNPSPSANTIAQNQTKMKVEARLEQGQNVSKNPKSKQCRKRSLATGMSESKSLNSASKTRVGCASFNPEPLCWEEQLNSHEARIIQLNRLSTERIDNEQNDTQPVVFHDQKWIKEMLVRKPSQFRVSSCVLPQPFERQQGSTTRTRKLLGMSGAAGSRSKSSRDKMQLNGKGMSASEPNLTHFVFHCGIGESEKRRTQTTGSELHACSRSGVRNSTAKPGYDTDDYSVVAAPHLQRNSREADHGQSSSTTTVDVFSVCVPHAADYAETLADDCRSVGSCATNHSQISDYNNETHADPIIEENSSDMECHQVRFTPAADEVAKYFEENYGDVPKPIITDAKRPKTTSPNSSSVFPRGLFRCKSQPSSSSSDLKRSSSSSQLVNCTVPSSVYLSEQLVELPRSVSPVKALMELRQNFCENMRKETKQLEFDLQELYLKKQLHER